MLKTSKAGHLSSKGHIEALEEASVSQSSSAAPNNSASEQTLTSPATLQHDITDYLADNAMVRPDGNVANEADVSLLGGVVFAEGHVYQNGTRVPFLAGEDPEHREKERRQQLYTKLANLAIYRNDLISSVSNVFEEDHNEDFTDGLSATLEALRGLELEDNVAESDDIDDMDALGYPPVCDESWSPYGSKTMFMLDMLDNLPRLRLSDDHMKAILWVMRECGTPDVPTFSRLRKLQNELQGAIGFSPEHHTSSQGNHFYMNHPAKLIALDWANPMVRNQFSLYPEVDRSLPVSEMWQAEKWLKEVPVDELSPMWYDGSVQERKHFYIKEITERRDGSFVLPIRWVTIRSAVHAECYVLSYSQEASFQGVFMWGQAFSIADPDLVNVPASELTRNAVDLDGEQKYKLRFTAIGSQAWMKDIGPPHPLRTKAGGRPMYRMRVMPWSDDVSGNVSKQYNPHTNIYIQNLSLPHKVLSQEYFVRFCSTSSFASSSEQFVALVKDFDEDIWHLAYDCQNKEEILFQLIPHLLPADNPQQSEHASHIGGNGLSNCRRDTTGGRDEEKETDEGYCALFKVLQPLLLPSRRALINAPKPGRPRRVMETIDTVKAQVRLACYGKRDDLQSNISQSGVKDKISQHWIELMFSKSQELQAQRMRDRLTRDPRLNERMSREDRIRLKEAIQRNIQHELWNEIVWLPEDSFDNKGINPHSDTPVEILHTWLLGNKKYVWHETSKGWSKAEEAIFATRLESSILAGLTTAPPRAKYLVQYKNSLIGKHFKVLQQLAIFHLHDLCSDVVFQLWRASGELGAMLWIAEIDNIEEYLSDLQVLIDNLLDVWALFDPGRILVKVKLHVLTHLVDDIRRFGPAILYSTEVFECWNAIFRMCSVFSNHLSPSKDIATTLGKMERFKHLISSGWWKHRGHWVQAGVEIRLLFTTNAEIQRRLGWADEKRLERGTVKLQARRQLHPGTSASLNLLDVTGLPGDETLDHCKYVISQSKDLCKVDFWVFYKQGEEVHSGRIFKILARTGAALVDGNIFVVIDRFTILSARDERMQMPILESAGERVAMAPSNVLFAFNAQHDCVSAGCSITEQGPKNVMQERISTSIPKPAIVHAQKPRYFLNTHSLHNLHLIRKTLPRELLQPTPFSIDSEAHRKSAAAKLRIIGPEKRAETQRKAQATREKNRKAAATTQMAIDPPVDEPELDDEMEDVDGHA
ncbi:hypothetical protein CC1G_09605 [Coprinopsis cinerea okayama7|uniref:Uncharacterized protein n=1 Tax=Coprinopsis cinerea (strain Okayama-7 / 130 / ATCC MYA-4618 / FGSC 9003) TaxID=240176 RepID=A8N4C1_COPC7|nr:hypothetical protein CC1G_09605 [Coprinopsis cinerea okayama7\|eukprot:XP_001829716.2 hypothetical protein CC1G_09605 [Coprinopsis cinerea okayama7\